eukprot:Sdes_comp15309_c0_seq1m4168
MPKSARETMNLLHLTKRFLVCLCSCEISFPTECRRHLTSSIIEWPSAPFLQNPLFFLSQLFFFAKFFENPEHWTPFSAETGTLLHISFVLLATFILHVGFDKQKKFPFFVGHFSVNIKHTLVKYMPSIENSPKTFHNFGVFIKSEWLKRRHNP